MPPKIPSTAIPEPAPDAALSARLAYAWNLLGTRLEESIEAGLDAVLGKANEDALRDEALVRKKQLSKRRQKKKLLKELEKAKAAEEALQARARARLLPPADGGLRVCYAGPRSGRVTPRLGWARETSCGVASACADAWYVRT